MNNKDVKVIGGEMPDNEKQAYIDYLEKEHNRKLTELVVTLDGEFVDLSYEFYPVPFDRIRRITGYLTGSTSSWNNAKFSEEKDRVKHSTEMEKI